MAHLEIEIKSLLGSKEKADALLAQMEAIDSELVETSKNTQLNHYFEGGTLQAVQAATTHLFTAEQRAKLAVIVERATEFSIRTRQRDDDVLLVVKASVDTGSAANTVSRLEFEEPVALTLVELDQLLLDAGFTYQAKWSRNRREFSYKGITVCFDKNAGYGYLAEFEKIVPDGTSVEDTRAEIETIMHEVGAVELDQSRLARMFAHYNQNWAQYYGTEDIFVIE